MARKPAGNSAENSEKKVIGRPFQPGQSGNPSGRPKGVTAWFHARYGADGEPLWLEYAAIAFDKAAPLSARLHALDALASRGYGQPVKQVEVTVDDRRETFKGLTDHDLHVRAAELGGQLNGQVH